jgi:Icc-related predicted phosphoesterase
MSQDPENSLATIRVMTVADIHAVGSHYDQLRTLVKKSSPDILACVGDILDMEGTAAGMIEPEECARRLADLPVSEILFVRGNHEHWNWYSFAEAWSNSGRQLLTLHGEAMNFGPLVIVGFPCSMGEEEPFRGDRPPRLGNPSSWISPLLRKYGPAVRSLWLMHEPPSGIPLAEPRSSNLHWKEAIEHYSPRVVVCGHDHQTPLSRGMWHHRCPTGTVCINVGQDQVTKTSLITFAFDRQEPCSPRKIEIAQPGGQGVEI